MKVKKGKGVLTNNSAVNQVLVVADSAVGVDAAKLVNTNVIQFYVEGADIRYRYDGADPTPTVGFPAEVGELVTVSGDSEVKNFLAIRTGGVSASLTVSFSRAVKGF